MLKMNYKYTCLSVWILSIVVSDTVTGCPFGTFGRDCTFTCHCNGNADCDDTSGQCAVRCARGWSGSSCQQKNAAYGRPTSQKDGPTSQNASLAVDEVITTCSSSKAGFPGWWSVELSEATRIKTIVLKAASTVDIKGWKIYAGMENNRMSMSLCTTIRISGDGATVTCDEIILGKYIMVVNRQGPLVLCDFQVKVCSSQWFGHDCSRVCNCLDPEEVCDSFTGTCNTGCSSGWTGTDCYTACPDGRYGKDCKYECGNCADDVSCYHVTGTCKNGCKPGWSGMFCTQKCSADLHGQSCGQACGHCYGVDACNVSTGSCLYGCEPGYTGRACNQECPSGWYGYNCSTKCGHCASGSKCDPKIGICSQGCQTGWQGVFCTQECSKGFYGINCKESCQNCLENDCDTVTGYCIFGCASGYTGNHCMQMCLDGTFGVNCTRRCGYCAEGEGRSCNATSGKCRYGCLPGYQGPECIKTCEKGFYGAGCTKCGVCYPGTTCDPITGVCTEGCAMNFFGELCQDSKPFSDEGGPQLALFLGFTISIVVSIMILVSICLVMIWRREHLPEMTKEKNEEEKEAALLDQNGGIGFERDELQTVI